jgi:hypothetical protein
MTALGGGFNRSTSSAEAFVNRSVRPGRDILLRVNCLEEDGTRRHVGALR